MSKPINEVFPEQLNSPGANVFNAFTGQEMEDIVRDEEKRVKLRRRIMVHNARIDKGKRAG